MRLRIPSRAQKDFWTLRTPWKPNCIMWKNCYPLLFVTKKQAKEYADKEWGYLRKREDIRRAPHFWRMPKIIRITLSMKAK